MPLLSNVDIWRAVYGSYHPDFDRHVYRRLYIGETVAEPFIVNATHTHDFMGHPGSGRKFEIQGVRILKLQDGLIAYDRRYYDFTGLLIQLGVLRGKPARPDAGGPGLSA